MHLALISKRGDDTMRPRLTLIPAPQRDREPRPRVGWVFAGGGARGAYEIGVGSYIFDRVARDLGRPLPIDVVSGTSVGALHASALAVWADDPSSGMKHLAARWTALSLADVIRIDRRRTFNMIRALLGRPPRNPTVDAARGGILDPQPLQTLLSSAVDFDRIPGHIAAGRLAAVSLTATNVGSGATTVFYQCGEPRPELHPGSRTDMRRVTLTAAHAMASAAIPFLFPAVRIGGALFCDGSLRQHVPLSPARQLGADALVVVNPRNPSATESAGAEAEHELAFPGPLFLLGKTLNALTLDRVDSDIEQLARINRVLDAGTRRYGSGFVSGLNQSLVEAGGAPVKPVALLHLHASQDIGRLAAGFVRSRRFRAQRRGLLERAFARLADGEGKTEADLLSYLLFDGRFTRELIDLGWHDAQRRHEEIVGFFDNLLDGRAPGPDASVPQRKAKR
jgi:NTE family protein